MSDGSDEFVVEIEPNSQALVLVVKTAVEETAKIYGSAFTRMVLKYALEFEAVKLNEKPPENLTDLEEITNYIVENLERYPGGYNALIYGIGKADSRLEGATGAGAKRAAYSAMKSIIESSGLLDSVIGTTEDAFEAICKAEKINKELGATIPARYIRGENNQVIQIVPNCPFRDACSAVMSEGISRLVGGEECVSLITTTAEAEIITRKHFDYRLDEFGEVECRGRVFEI
ncbi:MAG: hypothetical protein ACTSV0_09745 [Candidatus Freyarchaeota archaeon]